MSWQNVDATEVMSLLFLEIDLGFFLKHCQENTLKVLEIQY